MQNHCAEIKLRAERKGGEILKRQKETGERATGHKNLKIGTILPESLLVTPGSALKDIGLTKKRSSKWFTVKERFIAVSHALNLPVYHVSITVKHLCNLSLTETKYAD